MCCCVTCVIFTCYDYSCIISLLLTCVLMKCWIDDVPRGCYYRYLQYGIHNVSHIYHLGVLQQV